MLVTVTTETSEPDRRPRGFVLAGATAALLMVAVAAAAGPPYLSFDAMSPWIVGFAIAAFVALFATPFWIHASLGRLEGDERWERALLWWGAASLALLAFGLLIGLPSGFGSDSLAGSLGLVIVVETALVLATLTAWLLAN